MEQDTGSRSPQVRALHSPPVASIVSLDRAGEALYDRSTQVQKNLLQKRVWHALLAGASIAVLTRVAAAQAPDPADAFFNDGVIHEIRLSVHSTEWQYMKDHWQERTYFPADFRWNGQVVRNVAVRSRGGGSRRPNKLSMRVDINRYTDGQTFLGLKSFVLRNNSQDASNMRERLAMSFFRRLGLAAPREAHTRLFVNNQYVGLYTIVEAWIGISCRSISARMPAICTSFISTTTACAKDRRRLRSSFGDWTRTSTCRSRLNHKRSRRTRRVKSSRVSLRRSATRATWPGGRTCRRFSTWGDSSAIWPSRAFWRKKTA